MLTVQLDVSIRARPIDRAIPRTRRALGALADVSIRARPIDRAIHPAPRDSGAPTRCFNPRPTN